MSAKTTPDLLLRALAAALGLLTLSSGASGQGSNSVTAVPAAPVLEWTVDDLYEAGRSVRGMIEEDRVYGALGEEIGDVENLIFSPDGRILSVIAEIGDGIWDVAGIHISVPWPRIVPDNPRDGIRGILVPVTEDSVEEFSVFGSDEVLTAAEARADVANVPEDARTGPRAWRATELIGDYARLSDGPRQVNYGYIHDLIISDDRIQAIVVAPDVSRDQESLRAVPYSDEGWDPGLDHYVLPYAPADITRMEPFDSTRLLAK